LIHGSGYGNVGDSAQMMAAAERLERVIPGCRLQVARMYAADDGLLWGGRDSAPSPHLYICRPPGRFPSLIIGALSRLRARSLAKSCKTGVFLFRAFLLVASAWCLKRTGILPVFHPAAKGALLAIRDCDLVYGSGGGNLNDLWLNEELLPRVATYRVAAVLGKPVIVSGQGVGPVATRLGRRLLKWGAKDLSLFSCRDTHASRDFLVSLGMDANVVQSLGDDATDLRCSPPDRIAAIAVAEAFPADGRPRVAVHVRLHDFKDDFRTLAIPLLASLFDQLIERKGCRLVFIPVTFGETRTFEADLGDAAEVYANMKQRAHVSFVCREKYSPPDMLGLIRSCSMLIGFSYHAWVFALSSGIPAFGFYFGEYFRLKSIGLFDWYNRGHWIWNIETLQPESVLREIEEVDMNYGAHREALLSTTRRLAEQVERPARLAGVMMEKLTNA
jgi:polysaccharide pyruvyl transferase WcaK-like protein